MSFYQIKQLGRKVARQSMTAPVRGTLDAVLKQDSDNSPCCVYNELVALRLGQRLGVPLAMGVPSVGDGGVYFASLTIGGLSINLPDLSNKKMAHVADRYPKEAAGVFVFDVWILNDDREYNLKANLSASPVHLFAAIDHEQTLLGHYSDTNDSLEALENYEVPRQHPLGKFIDTDWVNYWISEIQGLSDEAIDNAVILGYSIGGVHPKMQQHLASALKLRRDALPELVQKALA